MHAYLVSLGGHDDIPIDRVLIVLGRHHLCDARLDSRRISRRHCCLALDRDGVLVRDLGSTNGTWINGRRVDVGLLHPGDELSIAHLCYRLEIRGADGITSTGKECSPSSPAAPAPEDVGNPPYQGSSPKETLKDDSPNPGVARSWGGNRVVQG